jgi:hypothetical protein
MMFLRFEPQRLRAAAENLVCQYWVGVAAMLTLLALAVQASWTWVLLISVLICALRTEYQSLGQEASSQSNSLRNSFKRRRPSLARRPRQTWHFARIRFQHAADGCPNRRPSVSEVVAQVYGREHAEALRTVKALYPGAQDVTILEVERHHCS